MKTKFAVWALALLTVFGVQAQDIDRSTQPKPAPAREIKLGEYESFTLKNGLQVYVVTNSKIPRVTVQLTLDTDPIKEGEAAGYLSMAGQMMMRGTENRSKEELDQEIDFIGASLSTFSSGAYGSALKKHSEKLFELMADVVLNPTFPEEELEKVRKQTLDGIKSSQENPDAIMANLSRVMRYGKEHPFGELETEESVKKITREHCVEYYNTYFRPNIGYMAVVGDITLDEAKKLVEKHFAKWEKADVPTHEYDMPESPEKTQVDLMDKSGAVQSIISITYPVEFKRNSEDYIPASLANGILGNGGFSGRLFQNLREDKGYTYGAYSSLSASDEVGSFTATAKVRTEVTDSAVAEFLYEMERIAKEPVEDAELALTKSVFAGRFARSLEDPRTIAGFAVNTALYDLPEDYYETYLQKVEAVTTEDIQKAAQKYIKADQAHVVTVGDGDAIKEKLKRFGKVTQYDMYGNQVEEVDEDAMTKDMDAEKVIAKYLEAVGGKDKLEDVKTLRRTASISMQGMTMEMTMVQAAPNKMRNTTILPMGMGKSEQIFDGEKGKMSAPQGTKMLEGEELQATAIDAAMFLELSYEEMGLTAELSGVKSVDGKNAYKVVYQSSEGQTRTRYYDAETFLLVKTENKQQAATFGDYKEVKGIMFPFSSKIVSPQMPAPLPLEFKDIEVNPKLDKKVFSMD